MNAVKAQQNTPLPTHYDHNKTPSQIILIHSHRILLSNQIHIHILNTHTHTISANIHQTQVTNHLKQESDKLLRLSAILGGQGGWGYIEESCTTLCSNCFCQHSLASAWRTHHQYTLPWSPNSLGKENGKVVLNGSSLANEMKLYWLLQTLVKNRPPDCRVTIS